MSSPTTESRSIDATGSNHSTASTVVYEGQEPFESFQIKVRTLAQKIYPAAEVVDVERMKGGGWNRIIGITLSCGERYVLRCPRGRGPCPEVADQVAVLRYIKHHTSIPVPTPTLFDATEDNALGWPFMIQVRLESTSLYDFMGDLAPGELHSIAQELVRVMSQMCTTSFKSAGVIRAQNINNVDEIRLTLPGDTEGVVTPLQPYSQALAFFLECFDMHTARARSWDPTAEWLPGYMERFKANVTALNAERPFSNRFALFHTDFEPRNILVRRVETGKFVIDAVLDFDDAVAAPIEVAWPLPHWLWTWDKDKKDSDPERLEEIPATDEQQQVKAYFEEEIEKAVPGFMKNWREGWRARELFHFAMYGFSWDSGMESRRADRFLGPEEDSDASLSPSSSSSSSFESFSSSSVGSRPPRIRSAPHHL